MEEYSTKKEKNKFWQDFWPSIQQTTRETENHIDKKIYGLSIGGIGIEVAIFQVPGDHNYIYIAWASCLLFVITIMLNLLAHVKSLNSQKKERQCISSFIKSESVSDDSFIYDVIEDENRSIKCINNTSIITMLAAIVCIIVFTFLNIK